MIQMFRLEGCGWGYFGTDVEAVAKGLLFW